jgi:hypothetical protein
MHDVKNSEDSKLVKTNSEEKFLNYSDAATMIGYRSYAKIAEFVRLGVLSSYTIPLSDRKRVKKSELVELVLNSTISKSE